MATTPQKISARTDATLPLDPTALVPVVVGGADRKAPVSAFRRLAASTVGALPSAATAGEGALRYVSDPAVGKGRVVVSTGAAWEYMDGTAV